MSGNAIRSGELASAQNAAVHHVIKSALFHNGAAATTVEIPISIFLLRSHYNGTAGMRPERRLRCRNEAGRYKSPRRLMHSGEKAINPRGMGTESPSSQARNGQSPLIGAFLDYRVNSKEGPRSD
jgi:hypothetical protein